MPTLDVLADSVFSDLADEAKAVFTQAQVEDFIRAGMVELNRVAPRDAYIDLTVTDVADDGQGGTVAVPVDEFFCSRFSLVYRVELRSAREDILHFVMTPAEGGESTLNGYITRELPDGVMIETRFFINRDLKDPVLLTPRYRLRVYGYAMRPLPYAEGDPPVYPTVALNIEEEYAVREFAKAEGFGLLTHDRSLFQQWQGQTNNTDVSPVMMMNMEAMARRSWDKKRGLIRTVRKYW